MSWYLATAITIYEEKENLEHGAMTDVVATGKQFSK